MRISCVIVSYNNGDLLENAVMSVVKQTRPLDEIIIADDASADGSQDLIDALSHAFPNINPIIRERNLGVSANRDLAMREAHGDFVTYLDGDDHFLPTKIEAEARAGGRAGATGGGAGVTLLGPSGALTALTQQGPSSRSEDHLTRWEPGRVRFSWRPGGGMRWVVQPSNPSPLRARGGNPPA